VPELIWRGKYDDKGRRVAPLRVALPFQTVETVNESAQDRQRSLGLLMADRPSEWRNLLVWGDKKYVLPSLLPEFGGKIDLIYIDPPFGSGQDFTLPIRLGNGREFEKAPSVLEVKAYRDTWKDGNDSYLQWFYETVVFLYDLLAPSGSLYVHMDSHLAHYAKVVLDEVFKEENFVREIIWRIGWISGYKARANNWARNHDTILFYAKDKSHFTFNKIFLEHDPNYKRRAFGSEEAGDVAVVDDDTGEPEEAAGKPIDDVWLNLPSIQIMSYSGEKTGYPTQKNRDVLERIVGASSNPGDLIADFFVGSGTTADVAERLGRRWIAADLSRFAIHTTRKRLLSIDAVSPFEVRNLGKYERQLWQAAEFGDDAEHRVARYRQFVLKLYGADPIEGYLWLHGLRRRRFVHVSTVDAPVTVSDVTQVALEVRKALGPGKSRERLAEADILGWDFAFEVNEVAKQQAQGAGIDVHFVQIPREVLDRRAVEQGDVQFFELGALDVGVSQKRRRVSLDLRNFVMSLEHVPADVQAQIKTWVEWVDYWAVDWDNRSDPFHNEWQAYRTKKRPSLDTTATHEYASPGDYRVVVKVIDILGNDTTQVIGLQVV
jgi:adenine-specific DNA-methyltransferase